MQTALYFQSPSKTFAPEKLAGVREIMDGRNCHVQVIEERPTAALVADLGAFWRPLGAIIDCGGEYNDLDAGTFAALPTVFFGHNPATLPPGCLAVHHDSARTAQAAARELMAAGHRAFAFVPSRERRYWSDLRETAFADAVALNGFPCRVFRATAGRTATAWARGLRRFLSSLPRPCAVFAANDKTALDVLVAARFEGLSVPDDLAVLGVDNFAPFCESVSPPLSSVEPDFRNGGRLAALMLLAAADGRLARGDRRRTYGPLRIVRRASTRLLARPDREVAAALDLIRREACAGLTAARVAATFSCSRRMADARFRKAAGRSILEEIHAVRLDRARQLLRESAMPLKALSDFCGFRNPNSLRKFFRRATGQTLSAARARKI